MTYNNPPIYSKNQPLHDDKPNKATRVINRFIILALLIITFGFSLLFMWGIQNEKIVSVSNNPVPVKIINKDGISNVVLSTDYCKNTNVTGTIRVSYVSNSREIFLPLDKEKFPKGCKKEDYLIPIPNDLPKDIYNIKLRLVYDLNPIKTNVIQDFYSKPINIP